MSKMEVRYGRVVLSQESEPNEVVSTLIDTFSKSAGEIYYPKKRERGKDALGFSFVIADCWLVDWNSFTRWCALFSSESEPELKEVMSSFLPPFDSQICTEIARSSAKSKLDFSWYFKVGDCVVRITIFRQSAKMEIFAPHSLKKSRFAQIEKFWHFVVGKFSFLAGATVGRTGPEGLPIAIPEKRKGYKFSNWYDNRGLFVEFGQLEAAYQALFEVISWANCDETPLSFIQCGCPISGQDFDQYKSALQPFAPNMRHSFSGAYKEGFDMNTCCDNFPQDGYWKFPILSLGTRLSKTRSCVSLIISPNERFLEFVGPVKKLNKYLEKHGWMDKVEFWNDDPSERWGLNLLANTESSHDN